MLPQHVCLSLSVHAQLHAMRGMMQSLKASTPSHRQGTLTAERPHAPPRAASTPVPASARPSLSPLGQGRPVGAPASMEAHIRAPPQPAPANTPEFVISKVRA